MMVGVKVSVAGVGVLFVTARKSRCNTVKKNSYKDEQYTS